MGTQDAIILPVSGKNRKSIGSRCALVANPSDIDEICGLAQISAKHSRRLLLSRLYFHPDATSFSMIGPFIGSPYAVMLLETARVWGAKEIVFFGWCGAVSSSVHIGDIIIPDMAFIDEGVSRNYMDKPIAGVSPSIMLQDRLKRLLKSKNIRFQEGPVWTTDAIFRETPEKVAYYQDQKALAVEMECSALVSAGGFYCIPVGCILVVSDEVSEFNWKPGFNNREFKQARKEAADIVRDFLTDVIY